MIAIEVCERYNVADCDIEKWTKDDVDKIVKEFLKYAAYRGKEKSSKVKRKSPSRKEESGDKKSSGEKAEDLSDDEGEEKGDKSEEESEHTNQGIFAKPKTVQVLK